MKETGIIMSGNHPQLIMELKKTITRRTWGLKEINEHPQEWERIGYDQSGRFSFRWIGGDRILNVRCPYGGVGDRLWVRATWSKNFKGQMLFKYQYHSLTEMLDLPKINILWKPSIHLHKEDAEIWLEITEVRAERVQDISLEDAISEGVENPRRGEFNDTWAPTLVFRDLWDSLNAKRSLGWDFNPWVWPISFKLITEGS